MRKKTVLDKEYRRKVLFEKQNAHKGRPMKHPFWIINSALSLLFILVLLFAYFFQTSLPEREHVEPSSISKHAPTEKVQINIAKIYEHDLFNTYKSKFTSTESSPIVEPLPEPPIPQKVSIPELPAPQFLEPINVTLKGIITVNIDNNKNRCIIENNNTKEEHIYRTGDLIDDARVIRIFSNKIIVLRTNGQQEILYLREQDAKNDPTYTTPDQWNDIIQKVGQDSYLVDTRLFTQHVTNLGQVVDQLGLTTAYEKGASIGCRIGQLDEKSFGPILGLQAGDIILTINGIPATNTKNRLKIYQQIVALPADSSITVDIKRHGIHHMLSYKLKKDSKKTEYQKKQSEQLQRQEKISTLKEKHSFAPTVKEIRKREQEHIFNKGREKVNLKQTNQDQANIKQNNNNNNNSSINTQ